MTLNAQFPNYYCNVFGCASHHYYQGTPRYNYNSHNVRSVDGSRNNYYYTNYGKSNIRFRRLTHSQYINGNELIDRANPRLISNTLCAQNGSIPSSRGISAMMFTWLQFLDHDITLSELSDDEIAPIPIPAGDPYFDPYNTGTQVIPFKRSKAVEGTGSNSNNPRQQINLITAWMDGSNVYGSDQHRADWLRSNQHGKLKVSPSPNGDLLPCNTVTGNCQDAIDYNAPEMDGQRDRCGNPVKTFVAGDIRASEQPGLAAMHTLFVREHNRICDELVAQGQYDDEQNYQYARRIVSGKIQSITFNEVLPALGIHLGYYWGYDAGQSPNIFNEFATAAYRLGHTMVNPGVPFLNQDCNDSDLQLGCGPGTQGIYGDAGCLQNCGSRQVLAPLSLRDAFFNPSILGNNGIDDIFRGLASETQQEVDLHIVDDIRNFLFGAPGSGGLDLASINIQRGRDHGLGDYNSIRQALGLSRVYSFNQITSNYSLAQKLQNLYGNVNNIDAWIGMLAEDHLWNSEVGPTLNAFLKLQFENIRNGDRFYFQNDHNLNSYQKNAIRNTKLADIINENTGSSDLENVFFSADCEASNPPVAYCPASGNSTYSEWIKSMVFGPMNHWSGKNNGYGDFTHISADVQKGYPYFLKLEPGYRSWWNQYYQQWVVWIDYNQDGYFDDNEKLYSGYGKTKMVYRSVPDWAKTGPTRMRIAMSGNSYPSPCGNFAYGEVEDYTINITEGSGVSWHENESDNLQALEADQLVVFPNPATPGDLVKIHYTAKADKSFDLQVLDATGRLIHQQPANVRAGENVFEIDTQDFKAGYYTILYHDGFRMVGERFVLIRK